MKIYKTLFFSLCLLLIPFFTFLLFLYKQDRLVILYKKNNKKNTHQIISYQEKLFGILITEKEERKIPFSITFDTFDKNHPENFLYTIMYQFFHYINLENIGKINYDLHHVALKNKSIIINGSLNQTELLSPFNEFLLLKSIFITIKNIFSSIEAVYFYDDEKPLKLQYHLPFFTEAMLNLNQKITCDSSISKLLGKYEILLIPFFQGNGNIIEGIFEKNIFQKNTTPIFIPKNKINSDDYFKEINQYQVNIPNKIIVYLTIKQTEKDHLDIVYYPVISENSGIYELEPYPYRKQNTIIDGFLFQCKKQFNSVSFHTFPCIPLINTVYPSVYIILSTSDKEKIRETLEKIKNINLNL